MIRAVSPNCLKCPTFGAGKCAGTVKRLVATEASTIARRDKKEGDISSVFSTFSGRKSAPLPERFRDLKRNLTTGFEQQIQKSWDELVEVLKVRTEEVATKRETVCSSHSPQLGASHILNGVDHSSSEVFRHSDRQCVSGGCCCHPSHRRCCRQRGGGQRGR